MKDFSKKFPVGTKVKYYPIKGLKNFKQTEITSKPLVLSNGREIVHVKGIKSYVNIDHIEVLQ